MAVWGGLTHSWEKKTSERQRRKGKIFPSECRVPKKARRDKKAMLSEQCKEIEGNNRKTRDLFKKIRDTKASISAWKISWQAIVHEVTKSLPRLSNWVYCSVYQGSISENQHAECKSTLEPDKNLTSQFSPVYNEDLWLSYWTGWKIKGNDAQRGFWHTRSVQ